MKRNTTNLKQILRQSLGAFALGLLPSSLVLAQSLSTNAVAKKEKDNNQTIKSYAIEDQFKGLKMENELIDKRTKSSKHFSNENGTYTAQTGGNYHYKDVNGKWKDIDLNIESSTRPGYAFENVKNDAKTYFPAFAENGIHLTSENGKELRIWNQPRISYTNHSGEQVTMNAQKNNATINGTQITYPNVYTNMHEHFNVLNGGGVENSITINALNGSLTQAAIGSNIAFKQFIPLQSEWFVMDQNGKEVKSTAITKTFSIRINAETTLFFGNITVFDNLISKDEALSIYMPTEKWTNEMHSAFNLSVLKLDYEVKKVNGGIEVSYLLPVSWLKQTGRQFPVTIDPTVTFTPSGSSGYFYTPCSNWYGFQRTASLYLENDLNFEGTITQISYNRTSTSGAVSNVPTSVYFNTTGNNILNTDAWNSSTYTGGGSLAYNATFNPGSTPGWKDILLSTPYNYTGNNLIVMVKDLYGGSGSAKYYNQSTTNVSKRQAFKRNDNSDPGDNSTMGTEDVLTEIRFEYTPNIDCDIIPNTITIASSTATTCVDDVFTISSTNAPIANGIVYTWEKSIDNGTTWTALTATSRNITINRQEVTAQYRLKVTCTLSNESFTSNAVTVTNKSAADCLCTSTYAINCTEGDVILNVSFLSVNNNSQCGPNGYTDYRTTVSIPDVDLEETFPISVTVGDGWQYESVGVWLDFNQNGSLDSLDGEFFPIGTGSDEVLTGTITVPADAVGGNTILRVVLLAVGEPLDIYSCGPIISGDYGEMEDYAINILIPVAPTVDSVKVRTLAGQPATINVPTGTLQMVGTVYPATMNQAVTWQIVNGTGTATINATGLVTARSNGTVWAKAISVEDITKMDSLQIVITNQDLGVQQFGADDLIVFPNPTKNNITLITNTITGDVDVYLMDLQGKVLIQEKVEGQVFGNGFKLDLSNYSNGIYILKVQGNAINYKQNIVKQ